MGNNHGYTVILHKRRSYKPPFSGLSHPAFQAYQVRDRPLKYPQQTARLGSRGMACEACLRRKKQMHSEASIYGKSARTIRGVTQTRQNGKTAGKKYRFSWRCPHFGGPSLLEQLAQLISQDSSGFNPSKIQSPSANVPMLPFH